MKNRRLAVHMAKRLGVAASALLLAAALTACGGTAKPSVPTPTPTPQATPTPTPAPALVDVAIVDAKDGMNIRSEPNTDSEILGVAYPNDRFYALGASEDGEWMRVQYKGKSAYLYAKYITVIQTDQSTMRETLVLTPGATEAPTPTPAPTQEPEASGTANDTPADPDASASPKPNHAIHVNSGERPSSGSVDTNNVTAENLPNIEDPTRH